MTTPLERIRIQLNDLIESAAADIEAQRNRDAAAAAAAIEAASSTAAISAAYNQGRRDQTMAILALIHDQRSTLAKGGVNAISLDTLMTRIKDSQL